MEGIVDGNWYDNSGLLESLTRILSFFLILITYMLVWGFCLEEDSLSRQPIRRKTSTDSVIDESLSDATLSVIYIEKHVSKTDGSCFGGTFQRENRFCRHWQ